MSGHSKWATTKHKKALIDAKRGKVFTKHAKMITIAARDGKSGDIAFNPNLRVAVENAKAVSMPKENIDRAIKRGIGGENSAQIEEITYESYAPGGVALLIECLTDNKNRTLGEIKALLSKTGGTLASSGSVGYLFEKVGQFIIDEIKNSLSGEELELAIIESGASDFDKEENIYIVTCEFGQLHQVKNKLESLGVIIESVEVVQNAKVLIDVPDAKKEGIMSLVEKIEDLDDVSNVYANLLI